MRRVGGSPPTRQFFARPACLRELSAPRLRGSVVKTGWCKLLTLGAQKKPPLRPATQRRQRTEEQFQQ
jgi:hypothetical protein